jgi:hypothetical protein
MYWKSLTPAVLAELKRLKEVAVQCAKEYQGELPVSPERAHGHRGASYYAQEAWEKLKTMLLHHADALIAAAEERDRMKEELEARTSLGYRRLLLRAEKAEAERDDLRRQLDEARAELKVGPNGELPECPCEKRRK